MAGGAGGVLEEGKVIVVWWSNRKQNDPKDSTRDVLRFLDTEERRLPAFDDAFKDAGAVQMGFWYSTSRSSVDEVRQRRLRRYRTLMRSRFIAIQDEGRGLETRQLSLHFDDDHSPVISSCAVPRPTSIRPTESSSRIVRLFSIFMSQSERESFLGDLEERYGLILDARGHRAASCWFWRQVVHSFFSLALDALKRLSALEKLIERYRRIGS